MRLPALLALAGTLIHASAHGEPIEWTINGHAFHRHQPPLLSVTTQAGPTVEVFRLEPGGCLIGPLMIKDREGVDLFRLPADTDYPAGCAHWPRKIIRR